MNKLRCLPYLAAVAGSMMLGVPDASAVTVGSSIVDRTYVDYAYSITFIDAGYAMPFAGEVTGWSLFAEDTGPVNMQVYRPVSNGYLLVGQNSLNVLSTGSQTFQIAESDRIDVLAGDLIAFHYGPTGYTSQVISFDMGAGGQTIWTYWPEPSTDSLLVGQVLTLTVSGFNESRQYAFNAELKSPQVPPVPPPVVGVGVPEPLTAGLFGFSGLALAALAARRRR